VVTAGRKFVRKFALICDDRARARAALLLQQCQAGSVEATYRTANA
jgi:hypothetical protein